ncbi:nitroreductase family protein [Haloplasma contractile]|uniref:Nitroreductase Energy production protein n=1 Tax=Haloplasma contractile SSD-17B TaxID=1033810 RepID=U2DXH1_9MOLU|nr:nitroreductase family protein [Haloplasma contractile]ERJ12987.1 Nitroreductase Energy production protein [Haloplasma contractile SSD-17B]
MKDSIIFRRRSIRKFKEQKLNDEQIKYLVKAGMNAQSAANRQPWTFIVVNNKEKMRKIKENHPYAGPLETADTAIIVCGDMEKEPITGYILQDLAISSHNICLAATELSLGSVWLGIAPREERIKLINDLFNLPETIIPFSVIALGYPDERKEPNDFYDQSFVHYEKW